MTRRKGHGWRGWKALVALMLTGVMLTQAVLPVWAEEADTTPVETTQVEDTRVVDTINAFDYEDYLGDPLSTEYSGRVWADKWVSKNNVDLNFPSTVEAHDEVKLPEGEDFLVGYSLHTASTAVSGQSAVPLDVVLVIDVSTSMLKNNKIWKTVDALNETMESLLESNPQTRVAVVTYATEAQVLLPLGRYTKGEGQSEFFWLTEGEDTDDNPEIGQILHGAALDSSGTEYEQSVDVLDINGITNIHMGIDTGMDLLRAADITTPDGEQRYPALMLMSDGSPTCAGSDDSDWWDPEGCSGDGSPDGAGIYSLKTLFNAAYNKQQVARHYNVDMQVYTVGVEVSTLPSYVERSMATVVLNPSSGLYQDNLMIKEYVLKRWESYLSGESPVVWDYTFKHPDAADEISSLEYVDGYFDVENADEIADAFGQVVEKIARSLSSPVETEADLAQSGYISYTDYIGEYMEVTGIVCIVWGYVVWNDYFITKTTDEENHITTYESEVPAITNQIDGIQYRFSNAKMTVTTDPATNNQTLEIKIPAALLPMRWNTLTFLKDAEGNVTQTIENASKYYNAPLRIFYTVSLRDGVLNEDGTVNTDVVSEDYIRENSNPDGTVNFYTNRYSKGTMDATGEALTVGDANVTFTPASNNAFYVFQNNVPLYTDESCTTLATEENRNAQILYYPEEYYQAETDGGPATLQSRAVACYLGDYAQESIQTDENGQLYITKGTLRGLTDAVVEKGEEENLTNTAATFRYPAHNDNGQVQLQLGANGKVSAPLPTGSLTVSKEMTGTGADLTQDFTFTITCTDNNAPLTGTYAYTGGVLPEYAESVTAPEDGSLELDSNGSATITLEHGQSITIQGLPRTATYTVIEGQATNYTPWVGDVQTDTATGTVGASATAAFTNVYEVVCTNFSFTKVDGTDCDVNNVTPEDYLSGAEFTLYQYTGPSWDGASGSLLDTQNLGNDWKLAGTQISGEQGQVIFTDLEAGHYRLVETKAPGGFQLPKGQWNVEVTINDNVGSFTIQAVEEATAQTPGVVWNNDTYYLMNYKPLDPPVTGGDGGRIYWFVGGSMMTLGALLVAAWMWERRRRVNI